MAFWCLKSVSLIYVLAGKSLRRPSLVSLIYLLDNTVLKRLKLVSLF